jgi:ABC-type branched-subunit amino acid transport system substrate-binding protein
MEGKRLFTMVSAIVLIFLFAAIPVLASCSSSTTSIISQPASTSPTSTSQPASTSPTSTTQPASTSPTSTTQPTSQIKTLTIGDLEELTGFFSVDSVLEEKEVQATAQYINDQGGLTVQGQQYNIKVVVEDGQSTLTGVAAAANKLIYDDHVQFVAGPDAFFGTGSSPVFAQAGVMDVIGFATNQPGEMDKTTPNTFLGHDATMEMCEGGIQVLKKFYPDVKSVVVVNPDDGSIPYLQPLMKDAFTAANITMVGDIIGFSNNTVDFNPIAAKIQAVQADAVFQMNGEAPYVGNIVKDLRALGDNRPNICAQISNVYDVMNITGGAAATNDVATLDPTADDPGNTSQMDAIVNMLTSQNGGKAPTLILMNASALYTLASVIKAANSLDTQTVENQWTQMKTIDTMFGPGIVGGTQTYGIADHDVATPVPYQIVQNGQVQTGWVTIPPLP